MVHGAANDQAWRPTTTWPGIDLYGKFANAADPTAEPQQTHIQSEAAAASWRTHTWSSGSHASLGATIPVSGVCPGYTSGDTWPAPWDTEGTGRLVASAPQGGEMEAAALQQSMLEHSTTIPVSGGLPGYTVENTWAPSWGKEATGRLVASAPQGGGMEAAALQQSMLDHSTTIPVSGGFQGSPSKNTWQASWDRNVKQRLVASAPQCSEMEAAALQHPGHTSRNECAPSWYKEGTGWFVASAPRGGEMEAAALQQSMLEQQAGPQSNSKAEAEDAMQEARVKTMQEQEAVTFQRYRSEQEVSHVNVCGCCVWWSAWYTCLMLVMFLSNQHGCCTCSVEHTCVI
jgi:hypothetical protein